MANADNQPGGRKRVSPDKARIAARFANKAECKPAREGVTPLNPAFFALQDEGTGVKRRAKKRTVLKGR